MFLRVGYELINLNHVHHIIVRKNEFANYWVVQAKGQLMGHMGEEYDLANIQSNYELHKGTDEECQMFFERLHEYLLNPTKCVVEIPDVSSTLPGEDVVEEFYQESERDDIAF